MARRAGQPSLVRLLGAHSVVVAGSLQMYLPVVWFLSSEVASECSDSLFSGIRFDASVNEV